MSEETPASLQARVRTIFGVHAGAMEVDEPWPESARSAASRPAPCLDNCTHNYEYWKTATPSQPVEVVPTSVDSTVPWGDSFTEVTTRNFLDGSIDCSILDRPAWYRPHHVRKPRESFAAALKREEHMDPECLKRSANRAKVNVRRACSQLRVDRIGTGTYRDNVQDEDLNWRIVADFIRLYKAQCPYTFKIHHQRYTVTGFDYVNVPEYQMRGALHNHFGLNGPHCINRLRKCWQKAQSLNGLDSPDGNFDIRKQFTRQGGGPTNSQNCGRYLGKYISKDMGMGIMFRKRYSVSRGIPAPEVHRFYFIDAYATEDLLAFIAMTFGVKLIRTGFGKSGPYTAAYATFVPP